MGRSESPSVVFLSKAREEKALAASLPANSMSGSLAIGGVCFLPAQLRDLRYNGDTVVMLAGGWVKGYVCSGLLTGLGSFRL